MSVQSEWKPTTTYKPAEFKLEYATIKVQAIAQPGSKGPELQVRISHAFDSDWQKGKFEEWASEWENTDRDEAFEAIYPILKRLRNGLDAHDRALIDAAVNDLEQGNTGLIRG